MFRLWRFIYRHAVGRPSLWGAYLRWSRENLSLGLASKEALSALLRHELLRTSSLGRTLLLMRTRSQGLLLMNNLSGHDYHLS